MSDELAASLAARRIGIEVQRGESPEGDLVLSVKGPGFFRVLGSRTL